MDLSASGIARGCVRLRWPSRTRPGGRHPCLCPFRQDVHSRDPVHIGSGVGVGMGRLFRRRGVCLSGGKGEADDPNHTLWESRCIPPAFPDLQGT